MINIVIANPDNSGTETLSSTPIGQASTKVATNAPNRATCKEIPGVNMATSTVAPRQPSEPSTVLRPILVRPNLRPTRAAAASPTIMNEIAAIATGLLNKAIVAQDVNRI